jgi:hypothetical protein
VVLGGIGTMLIVLAWSGLFPALRRLDKLVPTEPVAALAGASSAWVSSEGTPVEP